MLSTFVRQVIEPLSGSKGMHVSCVCVAKLLTFREVLGLAGGECRERLGKCSLVD